MPRSKKLLTGTTPSRNAVPNAIRTHLKKHGWSKASDVVAALAEQGINTTEQNVYSVRCFDKNRKQKKAAAKKVVPVVSVVTNSTPNGADVPEFSFTDMVAAKNFVHAACGIERARRLLDGIELLSE
jgi:hypothetical protein